MTANPRLFGAWAGVDAVFVTMAYDTSVVFDVTKINGSSQAGLAVKIVSNGTVGLTTDASAVFGRLESVESDGYCRVQVDGFCRLPGGNGATLTPGLKIVGAVDGSSAGGYIRMVAVATLGEVAVASHRIIESGTATAVNVQLGV